MIILAGLLFFIGNAAGQETSVLQIDTGSEASPSFTVEIANTPELIAEGLRAREALGLDAGMLFDYGAPGNASRSMEGITIPLDVLFINSSGRVIAIARNAKPQSRKELSAGATVMAILEINAGRSAELDIQPGALVRHDLFGTEVSASAQGE